MNDLSFMSLPLAHVVVGGVEEWRLRTLHVAQAHALGDHRIGTAAFRSIADRAAERLTGVVQAEERDHVVLIDAVARYADRTDECVAAEDRHAAGEDLQTVADAHTGDRLPYAGQIIGQLHAGATGRDVRNAR